MRGAAVKWWVDRGGQRLEVAVRRVGEQFEVELDGRRHTVELVTAGPDMFSLVASDGRSWAVASQKLAATRFRVSLGDRDFDVHLRDPLEQGVASAAAVGAGPQEIRAPIPGKVVAVLVSAGAAVRPGQPLVVLEAMKMENQICAEGEGTVETVAVSPGGTVEGGQLLVVLR